VRLHVKAYKKCEEEKKEERGEGEAVAMGVAPPPPLDRRSDWISWRLTQPWGNEVVLRGESKFERAVRCYDNEVLKCGARGKRKRGKETVENGVQEEPRASGGGGRARRGTETETSKNSEGRGEECEERGKGCTREGRDDKCAREVRGEESGFTRQE
jgi:hypothetical protein